YVEPSETAKKLRKISLNAHFIHSHTAHFYILSGPDFILGPNSNPSDRNITGIIKKVGLKIGKKIINARADSQRIQEIISGRAIHPINNLPGGMAKGITSEQQNEIEEIARRLVDFGKFTLQIFENIILKNREYMDMINGDIYRHETYYMGIVDSKNKVNFYDGDIRVVDPKGKEFVKFNGRDYLHHIAEHVEQWSYLKFPFLKKIGWKGFIDGKNSGIYRVAPLARLNVADGMATPIANESYETMYETLGEKPAHATLAMHWARVIEIVYAAERIMELIQSPNITDEDVRNIPTHIAGEGVGVVEAPRGTLIHHYWTDNEAIMRKLNIIVGTGNNNAAICMSVKRAAERLIKNFRIDQGILNMVEMAFRAYDPCLACATHTLPGHMPLEIQIYDSKRNLYKRISRRSNQTTSKRRI
ncbi:MAG: Ni/Fe hydrogenase subunit alpha, partial [Candidatus Altiarchaeales archaeon]